MMTYTFKKYKDVYTIKNTGVVNLTYTLTRGCGSTTQVETGSILPNGTTTLPINYIDGIYQITISDNTSTEELPDILFYNNFLLYIIDKVNILYCKCGDCGSCKDCNEVRCDTYLNLLSATNSYLMLNYLAYQVYLKSISQTLQCDIDNITLEFTARTQISGNEEILEVMNQVIASHYMAFYLNEYTSAIDDEERAYINEKFKYVNISKCLKKIGINTQEIINNFTDLEVFYWQEPDTTTDIADVMLTLTQGLLDTKTHANISVFEQGKIITYPYTGRAVFVLQETADSTFVINDSLGNDITDEFSYQYNSSLNAAVFVSINPVVPSSLYFKFKNNL